MARFNEILAGRYNRFLQKLFVLKGGPPSPQLSSEIGIAMVLFNGVENRWLESWERFFFTSFLAASAANEGGVRLRNPAGSNVMVVIERVEISELLPDNPGFAFGTATADLGTVGQGAPLDTRRRTQPTSIPSSQNTAPTVPPLTGPADSLSSLHRREHAVFLHPR